MINLHRLTRGFLGTAPAKPAPPAAPRRWQDRRWVVVEGQLLPMVSAEELGEWARRREEASR